MTKEMQKKWLEAYNELEKQYDKEWDKLNKSERDGNEDRAKKHRERMDLLEARQQGMVDVLNILGYTLTRANSNEGFYAGNYAIVVNG